MTTITVSLAMAEKLKIAGWAHADSVHYWCLRLMSEEMVLVHSSAAWVDADAILADINIAAPTAEEILRKLPKIIVHKEFHSRLYITPYENDYEVGYSPQWNGGIKLNKAEESLADAAAAMTCYLVEQGLLSL